MGGLVLGWLGEIAVVAAGGAALVPPWSLPLTLVLIAGIVVGFAWPIRRAVQGKSKARLDPFRAMRIAVLAKASTAVGALVLGVGGGFAVFLATRTVPQTDAVWLSLGTAAGALVLLAGGLVAEWCCTLPPPEEPEPDEDHAHAR
nr:DUF3180 domain-containing protein [Agromyces seonyuensis]